MDFLNTHLLSLILFFPTLAAFVMLFLPSEEQNKCDQDQSADADQYACEKPILFHKSTSKYKIIV